MKRYLSVCLALTLVLISVFTVSGAETGKISIGDYLTFGSYPQKAEGTDTTPIEWLVLDVRDGKALLLSKYGLEAKPYNEEKVDITWENCTLRAWLNGEFFVKAFNTKESDAILFTTVDNSDAQGFDWSKNWPRDERTGGNDTLDRVFLLSYAEAHHYLGVTFHDTDNRISRVAPTAYLTSQGYFAWAEYTTTEGLPTMWWWLRSPGRDQNYAADVRNDGSLNDATVEITGGIVRPALWLNLEAVDF